MSSRAASLTYQELGDAADKVRHGLKAALGVGDGEPQIERLLDELDQLEDELLARQIKAYDAPRFMDERAFQDLYARLRALGWTEPVETGNGAH